MFVLLNKYGDSIEINLNIKEVPLLYSLIEATTRLIEQDKMCKEELELAHELIKELNYFINNEE